MGLRQCEKCSEMVDEAKAFCPGCGNAFVEEEKRSQTSNFDTMDSTVQLGQTMYNQMLSDMGLNISKAYDPAEIRVDVIEPLATEVKPQVSKPVPETKSSGNRKWIIAGVAVILVLLFLVIAIAGLVFVYWVKFR